MLSEQELAIERRVLKLVRDELAQQALYEEAQGDRTQTARDMAQDYLQEDEDGQYLNYTDAAKVLEAVIDDLFLLGPLEELLWDEDVSEIDINAPDNVRVEVGGVMHGTRIRFEDDDHVKAVIDRIVGATGNRCDEGKTMCNCVLVRPGAPFDGSRVNATCMPTAVDHHELCIRKFKQSKATLQDLMESGMFDQRILEILEAILVGRMNFLIVGGTGTGKTTLLNALCRLIPRDQRMGILEDTPEIRFEHPDVFRNQARPANAEGEGEVTIRDLVINSLRKRPDRIIVGECRGPEAFDMLRAISSGHLGSITTIHANDARGAMPALLNMVQQAGMGMEAKDILDYVSRCFDFVVAIERGTDGQRRITEIAEIQGMEGDKVRMGTIVKFEQDWTDGLQIEGTWVPTGERISPEHISRMRKCGVTDEDWWYM